MFLEGFGNVIDVKINEVEVTFSSFEGMCFALEDVPSGQWENVLEGTITDAIGRFSILIIACLTCVNNDIGLPLTDWEGQMTYHLLLWIFNLKYS